MTISQFLKYFVKEVCKIGKVEKKKSEKYTKLLSSAFELFKDKGVTSVSIDEIVKRAGVAKGTFYLYFKDKFDLISHIILRKATEYLSPVIEVPTIKTDEDFELCLTKFIEHLVDFLESNKTLTVLIDKNLYMGANVVVENCDGPIKELYNNILLYFQSKGYPEKEVKIKMYAYINMTLSCCCNAILRAYPYTLEEIKPQLYDIIIGSVKIPPKEEAI